MTKYLTRSKKYRTSESAEEGAGAKAGNEEHPYLSAAKASVGLFWGYDRARLFLA